jgi:hypothetical protein
LANEPERNFLSLSTPANHPQVVICLFFGVKWYSKIGLHGIEGRQSGHIRRHFLLFDPGGFGFPFGNL